MTHARSRDALPNDAFWVYERTVMAGPYPGSLDSEKAIRDVSALVDAGARTFVDLTEEGELRPYAPILEEVAAERAIECQHRRFPIVDLGTPDQRTLRAIIATVRGAVSKQRIPYIHCWGGVGRTGTVIGCMLREDGATADAVLANLRRLRSGTVRADRPSPETSAQCELVLAWHDDGTS